MNGNGRGARWGRLVFGLVLTALCSSRPASAHESWDAIFLAGNKVGYVRTEVTPLKHKGRDLVRVQVNEVLTLKRGNDQVTMKVRYGTLETPNGEVLRLDYRTLTGQEEMRNAGDVIDGQMIMTFEGGGQAIKRTIPWPREVRGPYAAEQNLSRQPIKPGESRDLKMFIPELNTACDMKLTARDLEEVELGGRQKRSLLRVDSTVTDAAGKTHPEMAPTMWVDSAGQVLKSSVPFLGGMVTYRTTKEAATAPAQGELFNLINATIVKVPRKIPNAERTRDVVYRVALTDGDPTTVFPSGRGQLVSRGRDAKSERIEVKTAGPNDGQAGPATVDGEFLRPNPLINSEDPEVISLMRQAIGNRTDPWEQSVAIEQWVFQNLKNKNFGVAFAPAKEVARNLEGDCTEHSVLTAAMCRAAGIPCRVVVGLIYVDQLGGFGFHMWNEVYVNRRWVAIDSTWNQSQLDAAHIKLAESSLDGVTPYETFLSVVRVIDKMTLVAEEIR